MMSPLARELLDMAAKFKDAGDHVRAAKARKAAAGNEEQWHNTLSGIASGERVAA